MIDESDFIVVNNYKKKFRCTCDLCGKDRGYRYKEDIYNPCHDCSIKLRNSKLFNPDPTNEFIVKNNKKLYKTVCKICLKDRGFVTKRAFNNTCLSCSKIKSNSLKPKDEKLIQHRKIRRSIKAQIYNRLKSRGGSKSNASISTFLPYTVGELMAHLESLFEPGMTWDNYGEWHIDHITPDSWFKYDSYNDDEFKKSWALGNLQPMWAKANLSKGNKYEG